MRRQASPVVAGVSLGLAVGIYAISFGVLAVTSGLTVAQACAMSALVFTGASQFAAVGVIQAGGSPIAAVGSALMLGSRNSIYGLAMSQVVTGRLPRRLLAAHLTIDESTALATAQARPADRERAFWAAGLGVFVFWNLGTLLGAVGGRAVNLDPKVFGLDVAFPAGFVALLGPHLAKVGGRAAAVIGGCVALALSPLLPSGLPIVLASLGALVGLRPHWPAGPQ